MAKEPDEPPPPDWDLQYEWDHCEDANRGMNAKAIEQVERLGKIPRGFEVVLDTRHYING
jgi:hypothetical protein